MIDIPFLSLSATGPEAAGANRPVIERPFLRLLQVLPGLRRRLCFPAPNTATRPRLVPSSRPEGFSTVLSSLGLSFSSIRMVLMGKLPFLALDVERGHL